MSRFLSRATVSRKPAMTALNALLQPIELGARNDAHHRLLWTLFADESDRKRDFIWREETPGEFLIVSDREPAPNDLFSRIDVKPFDPRLAVGDRLDFVLRANATRAKKGVGRVDVVMDVLHAVAPGDRADRRMELARIEGASWLERQGVRNGFAVKACDLTDYQVRVLPGYRGKRTGQPQFGIIDLQGVLEVTEPERLRVALGTGLGRAKAFGCGLMLVRRTA